jgi:hypothetical protein
VLAAVAVAVALVAVPLARADGDPASDVLYTSNLFPSYDSGMSPGALKALVTTIDDSKAAGYEVRVAVIAKQDDLGAVTSLWAKPRQYARFLGAELGIVYKGPVLIVMPAGVGFYHGTKDPGSSYAALRQITTSSNGDALAQAAIDSVAALATAAGRPFTPQRIPAASKPGFHLPSLLIWLIAIFAPAVIAGVVAAMIASSRRRRAG